MTPDEFQLAVQLKMPLHLNVGAYEEWRKTNHWDDIHKYEMLDIYRMFAGGRYELTPVFQGCVRTKPHNRNIPIYFLEVIK